MPNHRRTHPVPVEGCYGCKAVSFGVLTDSGSKRVERKEQVLAADLPAYRRLRRDGLQPKGIDGAAELEKHVANGQWDIDLGRIVPLSEKSRVEEGYHMAQEMGLGV